MSTQSLSSPDSDRSADSLNSLLRSGQDSQCLPTECLPKECLPTECLPTECLPTECLPTECLDSECGVACEAGEHEGWVKRSCCNTVAQCVWGVLMLCTSVGLLIFTPLDFMLWEKLNMRPGFPPYEWWADPPDEVRLRAFVFNVTNHERFLAGLDDKLHMEEVGPVVYLEKLLHSSIRFNNNNTLSYTAQRFPILLPAENTLDLNATLIVPNMAVLGIASFLHSAPYLVRAGFRFLVNTHGSKFFLKKTVYECLWEYREPVLDTSKSLVPGLVPVNNLGMLARIYSDFTDEVTVSVGPQSGHKSFFHINRFRGQPQLPGYDPEECPDRVFGSTEGVMYHQRITKQDVLLYWRKTVCKMMPLHFDREMVVDSVPVYRFNLSESVFARVTNGTDCYDTQPSLPPGISDASKCYFDFPMVMSYPHFYTGEPPPNTYVTGMKPNSTEHYSYAIVEPLTGTPFRSVARMQSNLRVHDLSGFSREYDRFSNLVLPIYWAEYSQDGLPPRIRSTIYFMVVILPPLSIAVMSFFLTVGCYMIFKQIYIHQLRSDSLSVALPFKNTNVNALAKNKIFTYEKEAFIRKPS